MKRSFSIQTLPLHAGRMRTSSGSPGICTRGREHATYSQGGTFKNNWCRGSQTGFSPLVHVLFCSAYVKHCMATSQRP